MINKEKRALIKLGREEITRALGALVVSGPNELPRGNGYAFTVRSPEGKISTLTVASINRSPMLSVIIEPAPAFTENDTNEMMSHVVYRDIEDSLGELPILAFGATSGFGVHLSGTCREDVLRCIVGMLARMACLSGVA
jgi:hypothetical protein